MPQTMHSSIQFLSVSFYHLFQILYKLGVVVYQALDYNVPADEECTVSPDLESVIQAMTIDGKPSKQANIRFI